MLVGLLVTEFVHQDNAEIQARGPDLAILAKCSQKLAHSESIYRQAKFLQRLDGHDNS